jgi:hypothetical protein
MMQPVRISPSCRPALLLVVVLYGVTGPRAWAQADGTGQTAAIEALGGRIILARPCPGSGA